MDCFRECFQAFQTLIFGDPRGNFRVVMAYVRAEKSRRQSIHQATLGTLQHSFLGAHRAADVYQKALVEFEARQIRDHFMAASDYGDFIFTHWQGYVSSPRSSQVESAFAHLCELSDLLNVTQLTDWIAKQRDRPGDTEPVMLEQLAFEDLPDYITRLIEEVGISPNARANLTKLRLLHN
jgi:hypothetical protein